MNNVIFFLSLFKGQSPDLVLNSLGKDRDNLLRDMGGFIDALDYGFFKHRGYTGLVLGSILMKGGLLADSLHESIDQFYCWIINWKINENLM